MTFLHDEHVLTKLLADTGLLDKLTKHAQQVNDEVKLITTKLANMLATQAVKPNTESNVDIYVRDLTDLVAYLNFLLRKNQRSEDGHLIVYHDASGESPPPDAEMYTKYKEFYILKDSFIAQLTELKKIASQPEHRVMRPLVKHLIAEANNELLLGMDTSFDNQGGGASGTGGTGRGVNDRGNAEKVNVSIPFAVDEDAVRNVTDPSYQNVSSKTKKTKPKKSAAEDFASLQNVLPFLSAKSISPYDMDLFARNIYMVLQEHKDEFTGPGTGPMLGQITQFWKSMDQNYIAWQNFVRKLGESNMNVLQALEEVPYDRSGYPRTVLEQIFGNTENAREAAQRLMAMINLSQQALLSLQRSPQVIELLGKDVIENQLRQARSLNESLNPLTRV